MFEILSLATLFSCETVVVLHSCLIILIQMSKDSEKLKSKWKCSLCGKGFKCKQNWTKHTNNKSCVRQQPCSTCKKSVDECSDVFQYGIFDGFDLTEGSGTRMMVRCTVCQQRIRRKNWVGHTRSKAHTDLLAQLFDVINDTNTNKKNETKTQTKSKSKSNKNKSRKNKTTKVSVK